MFACGKTRSAANFWLPGYIDSELVAVKAYHLTRRELPLGKCFQNPKAAERLGFVTRSQSAPALWKSPVDGLLFCIYVCCEARACLVWLFLFFPLHFRAGEKKVWQSEQSCYWLLCCIWPSPLETLFNLMVKSECVSGVQEDLVQIRLNCRWKDGFWQSFEQIVIIGELFCCIIGLNLY